MAAVLTRNPDADQDIQDPIKENGSRYRYEMIFNANRSRAYADTAAELVGALIPGYDALDADQRLRARVEYATSLLSPVQASLLQEVDQRAVPAEEMRVLLQPRFEPVTVEEWSSEVPLVLLDVHYAPFSDLTPPMSTLEAVENPRNIVWLRAAEDLDLLISLAQIGSITVSESTDYAI